MATTKREHSPESEQAITVKRFPKNYWRTVQCGSCLATTVKDDACMQLPSESFYRITVNQTGHLMCDITLCVECMRTMRDKMSGELRKV